MITLRHLRRPAALAAGVAVTGALAAFGSAPAFATSYTQIYGSGAAIQNQLFNNILIPDAKTTAPWDITPEPVFTATSSGAGFSEFGNTTGKLDLTQDPTADALSPAQLDAWVATDSPPTGPVATAGTQLHEANLASGTDEIVVPTAQTPLDVLLSTPSALTLYSKQKIKLTALLLSELYAGTLPSQTSLSVGHPYPEGSWGALLVGLGLTPETSNSTPPSGDFYENGSSSSSTGGWTPISVEVRKNGAGATLNLKDLLFNLDSSAYLNAGPWASPILQDENAYGTDEWPSTAPILPASTGNTTDAAEVLAVDGTPGTIGYGTAGDAAANTTPFTNQPSASTDAPKAGGTSSASHQILYAQLQDNGDNATPVYADPEGASNSGNLYTGADININGDDSSWVGSWTVPSNLVTGSWAPTEASDPDVYDHSGGTTAYYPLESILYELSWSNFSDLGSDYSNDTEVGFTAQQLVEFATSSTGQSDINSSDYYDELPSAVLTDAQDAAADVD
jgi:hypothetical protein